MLGTPTTSAGGVYTTVDLGDDGSMGELTPTPREANCEGYTTVGTEDTNLLVATDDLVSPEAQKETFCTHCCTMICGKKGSRDASSSSSSSDDDDLEDISFSPDTSRSHDHVVGSSTGKRFLVLDEGTISKELNNVTEQCYPPEQMPIEENFFYTDYITTTHELASFIPEFHGTSEVKSVPYINMQDLTHGYSRPCLIDIRLGDQVLAPHALSAQADEARAEMAGTTLETHGLLLKGMRVWDSTTSKYTTKGGAWGKEITPETFRSSLQSYFKTTEHVRIDVLMHMQQKVDQLLKYFQKQTSLQFYGTSLLFVYEGTSAPNEHSNIVKSAAKLIDFDHVFESGGAMDNSVTNALVTLKKELALLQRELMQQQAMNSFSTKNREKWSKSPKSMRRSASGTPEHMEDMA